MDKKLKKKVILTSANENHGIDDLWKLIEKYQRRMIENDEFYEKRQSQLKKWFWSHLKENLFDILLSKPNIKNKLNQLESQVIKGELTPGQASDMLINQSNFIVKTSD